MDQVDGSAPAEARFELPYRSKTDLVAEHLRREIQHGRPAAGERLVVSRVAQRLGVSKVPVREAVTRLIGEGLLILRPNVGPVVPQFTAHEVVETAMMRVAIERLGLQTAMPAHTPDSLHHIEEILGQMGEAHETFPELNVAFHVAMIDATPYRDVVRLASTLLERTQRYRTTQIVPGYQPNAHREHWRLFEHLRRGDLDALQELNEAHIMDAAQQLTDQMGGSSREPHAG